MQDELTTGASMTPDKLLAQANALYGAREFQQAIPLYEQLIVAGSYVGWSHFSIARSLHALGQDLAALDHLDIAVEVNSDFFWAYFLRLELRMATTSNPVAHVLQDLDRIRGLVWPKLSDVHVTVLERACMIAWDAGAFAEAVGVLEKLAQLPQATELTLVRVVERSTLAKDRQAAATRLMALPPTRDFSFRILAAYFYDLGDAKSELACLRAHLALAPQDFQAYFALARTLARLGETAALADLRANEKAFAPRQRMFIDLIVALEKEATDEAYDALIELARIYREAPLFPGIRLCYLLGERDQTLRRDEVLGILAAFHPGNVDVALARMNAALRAIDFERAFEIYSGVLAGVTPRPLRIRLAHIDLLAQSGRADEAEREVDQLLAEGDLNQHSFRIALRVLSEVGRNDDAVTLALPFVGNETNPEILEIVVRSARKCGRMAELFAALPEDAADRNRAHVVAYEAAVEDLVAQGDAGVIARLPALDLPPARLARILSKVRSLRPAPVRENCLFLCADRAYLWSSLVAMVSAGIGNAELARNAPFILLAEAGDTLDRAQYAAARLNARFGLSIQTVDAADVVGAPETLDARYGFFTGGQSLSLAAYYRIFLADHLGKQGQFAKGLYIDADIVVRRGLAEVFDIESGMPLMARPEIDRPEVRNAVRLLGLKGTYFNSGVLRFDFRNPDFDGCITRAIHHARDPLAVRQFQDQCALNMGFEERHEALPVAFNAFRTPRATERDAELEDAVVVHYIDRPKPWDSLYRRNASEWFSWSDLVSEAVQPEDIWI